MNHYELLAIVTGRYTESEVEPVYQKIEDIVKKHTSVIHYRQNLDRKKLAYPIEKQTYGYYFLVEFDAEPSSVQAISSSFALWKDIIRFQIIRRETVGKQKTHEIKQTLEQEAFGKRTGKTLGDMPILGKTVATAQSIADAVIAQVTEVPVASAPVERKADDAPLPEKSSAEKESGDTDVSSRKKQEKVSYEELDKKLDDILNNDIL